MLSETEIETKKEKEGSELTQLTFLIDSEHETLLNELSKILDISNGVLTSRMIIKELDTIQEEIQGNQFDFIKKYFKGSSFEKLKKNKR